MTAENERICTTCGEEVPTEEESCLNCGTYKGIAEPELETETPPEPQEPDEPLPSESDKTPPEAQEPVDLLQSEPNEVPKAEVQEPGLPLADEAPPPEMSGSGVACPHCGKTHPPGARFCPFTSQRIFETPTCRHCGNSLQADWVVCPHCGQPLSEEHVESHALPWVDSIVHIARLGLRLVVWMVGVELILGVNLLLMGVLLTAQIIQMAITNAEWRFEEHSVGQEYELSDAQISEGITQAADLYYPGELADVETLFFPPDRITVNARANGSLLSLTMDINLVGNRPVLRFQDFNGIRLPIIGDVLAGGINRGLARALDKAGRQIVEMRVESDQIIAVLGPTQAEASRTTSAFTMTLRPPPGALAPY